MRQKLIVNNIKCGGCETTVRDRLSKIEGVTNISADSATGAVEFDYVDELAFEKVREKLNNLGYTETDPNLIDTAKSYVSCMIGKMKQ